DLHGLDLQANPLAGLRQRAHREVVFLASRTERYQILAPERAMLPAVALLELQHHGLGWVFRIEENIREQLGALTNLQAGSGPFKEMLAQPLSLPAGRLLPPENGMIRLADEFPGRIALQVGARRGRVIDPAILDGSDRAPQQVREFGRQGCVVGLSRQSP